jgi:hypothetical protein
MRHMWSKFDSEAICTLINRLLTFCFSKFIQYRYIKARKFGKREITEQKYTEEEVKRSKNVLLRFWLL